MTVVEKSPLAKGAYEPVTWNFKLLAQHELQGFGGMGEGMAVQIAPDGRRIIWLAHESAPKNFTARAASHPPKPQGGGPTDLPPPVHALELAGADRQHHGGRLPDPEGGAAAGRLRAVRHIETRKPEIDRLRRLLGSAFARRPSAVVLRRRIRAHGRRRSRLQTDPSAG